MDPDPDPGAVDAFLTDLQRRICAALEAEDGEARFHGETFATPGGTDPGAPAGP